MRTNPLDRVRIGFIGLGYRAQVALKRYAYIDGVEIKAICDESQEQVDAGRQILESKSIVGFDCYAGEKSLWREVVERDDIDLVYISTPWATHAPMAVYSMERGKHVAVEVPAAMTVAECWQIVDTSERTGRHCVLLENCCYDPFTLNILNMVQQGLFGEINHAEGSYIHRLCERIIGNTTSNHWMTEYYLSHTGNIYPTHGIGPAAQAMDINRGDRLLYLTSMSSKPRSFDHYVDQTFGDDSTQSKIEFKLGDTNTTLIQTALGKTIVLQHDISSPRPYSRTNLLSGTKGISQKYPQELVAFMPDYDDYLSAERLSNLLSQYEHPILTQVKPLFAKVDDQEVVRRGLMDYLMDHRLVHCLRSGLPTDIDVYDGAAWSSLAELSESSVVGGSTPIEIPDFTRGKWQHRTRLKFTI